MKTKEKHYEPSQLAKDFERDLFSLIKSYCDKGISKPDLVSRMKYVTECCVNS